MDSDRYYKPTISQQEFHAGQSFDQKLGQPSSFAYARGFDWRKEPSELVQAMQPRQIDDGNLTDLIIEIVQVGNGIRYAIGKEGTLYKIDENNDVTTVGDIGEPAGGGLLYRADTDMLYITGQKSLHAYGFISQGTPQMYRNFVAGSFSTNTTGSYPSIRTGGAQTYTLQNALNENDTHKIYFTSDIEPLSKFRVNVSEVGTGNWTFELHDPLNRVLATVTVANADMTTGNYDVEFTDQVSILVKPNARIYHLHAYSSDGTGKLVTSTLNNLNTADFNVYADRFIAQNNGWHGIEHFLQYIAILNGRYLSLWEPLTNEPSNTEFVRHKLTVPDNYEGCGIAKTDEFLIMAFEKIPTDNSDKQFQEGLLTFWDGLSGTYNFYIETKEGAPRALTTIGNIPHVIIAGTLYAWLGGKQLTRIRDLPNIDNDFTGVKDDTELYPNMMTVYKKLLHMGYPSSSSNTGLEFGVYNYGATSPEYNPSFGYQYQNSHGSRNTGATALKIGCVRAFGDEMYISWQKGSQCGLDIVDSNCKVASDFKVTMRKFDARNIHKPKGACRVIITTNPVPEGTTVYPTYKIDDETEVVSTTPMAEGSDQIELVIDQKKFRQIDYGLQGTSEGDVTEPLRVRGVALEWDPLSEEDITGKAA